jgi:Family of unknown function (DUF6262)
MPPDPTPLATAAGRKREHAQTRAREALRDLDQRGCPITFRAVARQAGVSRQWLYKQPELRKEIERLRARRVADTQPRVLEARRASDASLRQLLENLRQDNRRLRDENAELRRELALAYGQLRSRSHPNAGAAAVASSGR